MKECPAMKKVVVCLFAVLLLIPLPAGIVLPAPAEQQAPALTERSSATSFTFRRIKMHPEPGIRAEAAGELLWPIYGTPFSVLHDDE